MSSGQGVSANEQAVEELIEQNFDKDPVDRIPDEEEEDPEVTQEEGDSAYSDTDEAPLDNLTPEELVERRRTVLALKEEGNTCFRKGDFEAAVRVYREAASQCRHQDLYPERAILYSNRAASELKLNLPKVAIHSASQAIKYNPNFPKGYLRRAKAYDLEDKLDESLEDFKKVLELDKSSKEALEAMPGLERRINERNEKMKTEMMDKLKDLGNLVLRPFGLSTNNFQMAQDPSTGGYSINFKQN